MEDTRKLVGWARVDIFLYGYPMDARLIGGTHMFVAQTMSNVVIPLLQNSIAYKSPNCLM
jgi:hypothetical protein